MALESVDRLPSLPPRPRDSHKGRFGTVLVVAGGRGMGGAAALCGAAAPPIGCRAGPRRHVGRGPAGRREFRAMLYDLSASLRRGRVDRPGSGPARCSKA